MALVERMLFDIQSALSAVVRVACALCVYLLGILLLLTKVVQSAQRADTQCISRTPTNGPARKDLGSGFPTRAKGAGRLGGSAEAMGAERHSPVISPLPSPPAMRSFGSQHPPLSRASSPTRSIRRSSVATCGLLTLISCLLSGGVLLTRAHELLKKEPWRVSRSFTSVIARQAPPLAPFAPQLLVPTTPELPVWPPTAERKHGVGVLLFAYGHTTTLPYFLGEAVSAARSLRALNPELSIGIVSNNETVDSRLFNVHLRPRSDLLFVGDLTNSGQFRSDGIARQWLTRLYYLALTPFEVTWALDSNTICCTPNSADSFMRAALATKLWGYDMVHASQRDGRLYPHNWNFMYRWTPSTSSVLREWLLLQLRRGVTADDQKTLLVAQMRLRASSIPLRIGQLATPLATAFYNVPPRRLLMRYRGLNKSSEPTLSETGGADDVVRFRGLEFRADGARITRVIHGPVHMLHTKDSTMCSKVNAGVQLGPASTMRADDNGNPLGETRQVLTRFRRPAANMSDYRAMQMECEFEVGGKVQLPVRSLIQRPPPEYVPEYLPALHRPFSPRRRARL